MTAAYFIQYQHRVIDRNLERRGLAGLGGQGLQQRPRPETQVIARQCLHAERHQHGPEAIRPTSDITIEQRFALQRATRRAAAAWTWATQT